MEQTKAPAKPSTNRRKLTGFVGAAVSALLIISSLFHIYTGGFGLLSTMSQRSLHRGQKGGQQSHQNQDGNHKKPGHPLRLLLFFVKVLLHGQHFRQIVVITFQRR